jgi:hypothetical protein
MGVTPLRKFFARYIDDVLIIGGMVAITAATFLLSPVAALYVLGVFLLMSGAYIARHPPKDGGKG